MQEKGFNTLYDISSWDNSGNWKDWKILHPPEHLTEELETFTSFLHSGSPSNIQDRDIKDWGIHGQYTVKEGFKILKRNEGNQNAINWNKVWNPDCIPKVNIFFWLLARNKLLTADNLRKRGFEGPSRCALCSSHSETALHLFLTCRVAIQVWECPLDLWQSMGGSQAILWTWFQSGNPSTLVGQEGSPRCCAFGTLSRKILVGKYGSQEIEQFFMEKSLTPGALLPK